LKKKFTLLLRRGISVLIGGAFEQLFCPEGREFEQANLQKFNFPGSCPGGRMLKLRFDWYIKTFSYHNWSRNWELSLDQPFLMSLM